jgi:hypothetical protein
LEIKNESRDSRTETNECADTTALNQMTSLYGGECVLADHQKSPSPAVLLLLLLLLFPDPFAAEVGATRADGALSVTNESASTFRMEFITFQYGVSVLFGGISESAPKISGSLFPQYGSQSN